jgi:hypothetical protein
MRHQSQYAGRHMSFRGRVGFERDQIIQHATAPLVDTLRGFGQRNLSSRSIEQAGAEALLQCGNRT